MSVTFAPGILGPEMAAPILWAPAIFGSFCRKPSMPITFLVLGGGGGGGGELQVYFMGCGNVSEVEIASEASGDNLGLKAEPKPPEPFIRN